MTLYDRDDFLLKADEASEMMADAGMNTIRKALNDPDSALPDPITISQRNLRLLMKACFKGGACFGFEEVLVIAETKRGKR